MESGGDRCRHHRNSDTSNHLRELFRLREDEAGNGAGNRRNVPGRTLGSVLYAEKRNLSNRTLLDIIREDSSKNSKKTWKHFKDKLRLKRAGAAWTSSVHIPASDVPLQPNNSMNNRMMMRRHSTRIPASNPDSTQNPATNQPSMLQSADSSLVENDGDSASEEMASEEEGMGEAAEGNGEGGPARMSLMALLAETDREMGIEGSYDDEEEEEEEEESCVGNGGAGEYNNCRVCMVRHKGAALIPCGHTFCRLCSRELWVQRGNCPLCNVYISEILDIF